MEVDLILWHKINKGAIIKKNSTKGFFLIKFSRVINSLAALMENILDDCRKVTGDFLLNNFSKKIFLNYGNFLSVGILIAAI
ncbi:MAG: hypothetical protein V4732_20170 [Pseudomonadota bacterium]